ncbi:MAG: hypothetical protein HC824_02945 [Synechococcales cyanobacterium RM1_1_8]|nr:hypothetical protein [Synechococcales cyanobacterium RM1_1_8]
MAIERSRSRTLFQQEEVVQLRQQCFTLGRVFEPGKYLAGELPDQAFELGLVEAMPPVRGKSEQLPPDPPPADPNTAA